MWDEHAWFLVLGAVSLGTPAASRQIALGRL